MGEKIRFRNIPKLQAKKVKRLKARAHPIRDKKGVRNRTRRVNAGGGRRLPV